MDKRHAAARALQNGLFKGVVCDRFDAKTFDDHSPPACLPAQTVRMGQKTIKINDPKVCPYCKKDCHKAGFSCHKPRMALNIKKERPNGPPFFYLCSNITLNGRNKKDKSLKVSRRQDETVQTTHSSC